MQQFTTRLHQIANRLFALFSGRIKAPLALRALRALWEAIKLILALLYFVLDELGTLVKWLALHIKPLELYFNAIKRLAFVLRTRGLHSPDSMVRTMTPYLTLPFVLIPISLLLPAKLYLLHLIAKNPLYAIPALILAKLFSAIFVKHTWDILRCVGRKSERIRRVDDKWLKVEHWAKTTIHNVAARLAGTTGFVWAKEVVRDVAEEARPGVTGMLRRARALAADAVARGRAWVKRWRTGRGL